MGEKWALGTCILQVTMPRIPCKVFQGFWQRPNLIKANALAVTGGSLSVVIGGGIGIAIRRMIDSMDNANHSDGILILIAVLGYLAATFFTSLIARNELGPLPHENKLNDGLAELLAAFKFLKNHHDAVRGIAQNTTPPGIAVTSQKNKIPPNEINQIPSFSPSCPGINTCHTMSYW